MKENFSVWCNRAFDYEGRVYENVPGDLGGPTKWGVTVGRVAQIKGVKLPKAGTAGYNALVADLKALREADIREIYKRDYWDAVRGDDLPPGLDFCTADFGLNSGPSRANKYLCRVLGKKESGTLSNEVVQAAKRADPEDIVNSYCDARAAFLRGIVSSRPGQGKFLKGWLSRVRDVRARSLSLVTMQPMTEPDPLSPDIVMPKADPKPPTPKDLRSVSRKFVIFAWIKRLAAFLGLGTGGAMTLTDITTQSKGLSDVVGSLVANPVLLTVVVGSVAVIAVVGALEALGITDYNEGRWTPSGTQ